MGRRLKAVTDMPVLLGVGISNAEQAVEAVAVRRRRGRSAARWSPGCSRAAAPRPRTSSSPRCGPPSTPARRRVIKYLGSKRRLVPVLTRLCEAAGARTALDLFTGTTRVAQAFKRTGAHVTAVDTARYSEVFARAYVETDATRDRPRRARGGDRRPERAAGHRRLLHRDVLRAVALLPAVQRRAHRRHPRRDRARARGHAAPPDPAHEPASRRPTGSTPPPACRWPT